MSYTYYNPPSTRRPISPPWGMRATKVVTMNVPFKVQSIVINPFDSVSSRQNGFFGQLQCILAPSSLVSMGQHMLKRRAKYQDDLLKKHRDRLRRRSHSLNSFSPPITSQPQGGIMSWRLKRLVRGPSTKLKKEEIYEKRRKREQRRKFRLRRKRMRASPRSYLRGKRRTAGNGRIKGSDRENRDERTDSTDDDYDEDGSWRENEGNGTRDRSRSSRWSQTPSSQFSAQRRERERSRSPVVIRPPTARTTT